MIFSSGTFIIIVTWLLQCCIDLLAVIVYTIDPLLLEMTVWDLSNKIDSVIEKLDSITRRVEKLEAGIQPHNNSYQGSPQNTTHKHDTKRNPQDVQDIQVLNLNDATEDIAILELDNLGQDIRRPYIQYIHTTIHRKSNTTSRYNLLQLRPMLITKHYKLRPMLITKHYTQSTTTTTSILPTTTTNTIPSDQ